MEKGTSAKPDGLRGDTSELVTLHLHHGTSSLTQTSTENTVLPAGLNAPGMPQTEKGASNEAWLPYVPRLLTSKSPRNLVAFSRTTFPRTILLDSDKLTMTSLMFGSLNGKGWLTNLHTFQRCRASQRRLHTALGRLF